MASVNTKPTVFIVPGGFHRPSAYSQLVTHLETAGFPTVTVRLPSLNSPNPKDATCARDTESVRETLISLIEPDGKDVVVLAHVGYPFAAFLPPLDTLHDIGDMSRQPLL